MKNICIILPPALPFPPSRGGAVETLLNLFVSENEKEKKYHLTIFSIENEEAREISKLYSCVEVIYIKNQNDGFKNKLDKYIKKFFHMNINLLNYYVINILREMKKREKPDLCIVEGGNYRDYQIISKYVGVNKMALHIHAVSTPKFNPNNIYGHFIFVSECAKRYWTQTFPGNGEILKNAIDEDIFCKNYDEVKIASKRKKLGISMDDFVVMYCGRLIDEKGVLELIKSINNVKNPHVKLLIIGSSNFAGANVTKYQKELFDNVSDKIIFTGFVNNNDLPIYYQLSDVVATPSKCMEAAPLVNIEGMISGKALITTSQGGILEYINPKGAIILDYNGNEKCFVKSLALAIESLAEDAQRVQSMGKSNCEYSQIFIKKNYFKNYSSIIEKIIS
ncbi:glycosyltransferase family 4 protein [Enterococcus faecium]|uniref:Glycosyltransferase family 4 protein n=1 Tax=Enterococcus faecium TaxID=1352 RepID=A0AAW8RJ92_ENTFC|nr:glycosyltransferase family 4 protein [Enterococcus faecium]MDT2370760.1 glycosyltransferase family 4 protein [Enterococcus faecium]